QLPPCGECPCRQNHRRRRGAAFFSPRRPQARYGCFRAPRRRAPTGMRRKAVGAVRCGRDRQGARGGNGLFPGEISPAPRSWAERAYRTLTYFNEVEKGGHFAAWEQPELFSTEIRAAFRSLR